MHCAVSRRHNLRAVGPTTSELQLFVHQVQVEQKSCKMSPQDGISIADFLTVADIERAARFYVAVFGACILSSGNSRGAPGYIEIANTRLIVNVGDGLHPTNHR
jgi:hypothetical protein